MFDRRAKTMPCKLDFFEVGRARKKELGADPTLSVRMPGGLGNIVADTNLGVTPQKGGYLQSSFVGMTSEHADETETGGGEPEDRLFVFRVPFLKTGIRKRADKICLRVAGINIVPAIELMPFIDLRPDAPQMDNARRLDTSAMSQALVPAGSVADEEQGRRRLAVPGHCNARSKYPKPTNALDFEFEGCMGGTFCASPSRLNSES